MKIALDYQRFSTSAPVSLLVLSYYMTNLSSRRRYIIPVAIPGVCILFFFKLIQSVDTATPRRGYRDGQAWIQRWPGVDTKTAKRGYSDGQEWIQRRPGVDIDKS